MCKIAAEKCLKNDNEVIYESIQNASEQFKNDPKE